MTRTLQDQVRLFVEAHQLETAPETRLLDLLSETGEVAKEALKATAYGRAPFTPSTAWESEVGDVFFALICLANSTQVDLEHALQDVLAKYAARVAERGEAGSGR